MIKISVAQLQKFFTKASHVNDTRLLPIYAYFKLECKRSGSLLIKSNGTSFVVAQVEVEFDEPGVTMLETKTVSGFVNFSKGKEITITADDKNIKLHDGFREISFLKESDNYQSIEDNSTHVKKNFSTELVQSIFLAQKHTLPVTDKAARDWKSFINVRKHGKKTLVAGIAGYLAYFKIFNESLPEIVLEPEVVSVVGRLPYFDYSESESYDYFETNDILYGFLKPIAQRMDLSGVLEKMKSSESFVVNRKALVTFCELVITVNDSAVAPEVTIEDDGDNVVLGFAGISGNQHATESVPVNGKNFSFSKISLSPKNLLTVLKDLGVEEIKVSKIPGSMIFTTEEEKDYLGYIQELVY